MGETLGGVTKIMYRSRTLNIYIFRQIMPSSGVKVNLYIQFLELLFIVFFSFLETHFRATNNQLGIFNYYDFFFFLLTILN
jgi:hypothetical protein